MPYIDKMLRDVLDVGGKAVRTPGELNYVLTCIVLQYVEDNDLDYQTINDILGALEGAKQEFYRRVAVPYEERKRNAHGDVFPSSWQR